MSGDRDDDSLMWPGDDDPTLRAGEGVPSRDTPVPEGTTSHPEEPAGRPAATSAETAETVGPAGPQGQAGSVMLIVLGILGGIYLLYTVGWTITAVRASAAAASDIAGILTKIENWFAVIAAPLWFVSVLLLARRAPRARAIWLVVGALVLVPWAFIVGGA